MDRAKIGGEGTNKTERKGDERVFCLNFCVPKMWEHLLRGLGARGRGERGKGGEGEEGGGKCVHIQELYINRSSFRYQT